MNGGEWDYLLLLFLSFSILFMLSDKNLFVICSTFGRGMMYEEFVSNSLIPTFPFCFYSRDLWAI